MKSTTCDILCLHYNQQNNIPIVLDRWFGQSHPPNEFILLDDESVDRVNTDLLYEYGRKYNCKTNFISFEHNENLPYMYNLAVKYAESDYVLMIDCSHLPFGKYFIEKQLERVGPKTICVPMFGRLHQNFEDPYNLFAGTFQPIDDQTERTDLINIAKSDGYLPTYMIDRNHEWYPTINVSFINRKTFLRFNEGYKSWGLFDLDYQKRCILDHFEIVGARDHALVHWDHPQPESKNFYKGHDARNRSYYNFCIEYYQKHNITILTPEIEAEIKHQFNYEQYNGVG